MAIETYEIVDRYGGRRLSTLRMCGGQCEGLGTYPTTGDDIPDGAVKVSDDDMTGWVWVRCEECGGSGKVSRMAAVCGIPRWIVHSGRFLYYAGREPSRRGQSRARYLLSLFGCLGVGVEIRGLLDP